MGPAGGDGHTNGGPDDAAAALRTAGVQARQTRLCASPRAILPVRLKNAWKQGHRLVVHGWIYSIGDGILRQQVPEIASLDALAAARCDDAGWIVSTPR